MATYFRYAEIPFRITRDTNLQWFQYSFVHRNIGTNSLLLQIGYFTIVHCTLCQPECETIQHILWKSVHNITVFCVLSFFELSKFVFLYTVKIIQAAKRRFNGVRNLTFRMFRSGSAEFNR